MEKRTKEEFLKDLNFPKAPEISIMPPGPKAQALLKRQVKVDSQVFSYPRMVPLAPVDGQGATIMDADGNYYIDLSGGVGVLNAGHSNPEVVNAIKHQVGLMTHGLDFPNPVRIEMSEKLRHIAPGDLRDKCKVFLCGPTGADSIEAAIKLSRFNTKRPTIIAFEGGWHGVTGASLSATGKRDIRIDFLPTMPEFFHVPYAYCYRCPFGLSYPECEIECAKFLEHVVRDPDSGATNPGAILLEPIQGEGGVVVPPPEFIREVRRICDEYDLLLIVDEIQTGFGRTGAMFACEEFNLTPDIMCVGKTLGGGLPMAAVLMKEELDTWAPGAHVGTFRGNLLSSAAGLAAIRFIENNDLSTHSSKLGAAAIGRLKEIANSGRHIGEVRGKGLFIGLEFVTDKESKAPAPEVLQKVVRYCFERGVLLWKAGRWNNVGRMMPALVITESLMHSAIDIFAEACAAVESELSA